DPHAHALSYAGSATANATRHSNTRIPKAAPPVCACGGRPLVRGRVWRYRGARARDACVPLSVGETEPTPPRGATPMSRSRLMPPGHRTARGANTPERDVGPVVFRAARSSAGLCAGDLSVLAEGRWVDDGR
ncbi:hypothetical protein Ctob_014704, partial [Chrysochromulina tobinii]